MKKLSFLVFLFFFQYNLFGWQFDCGSGAHSHNDSQNRNGKEYLFDCSQDQSCRFDLGNFFYIPTDDDDLLELKVNFHFIHKSTEDPQNFTEEHMPQINSLVSLINSELFRRSDVEEKCFGVPSSAPNSVDTRIQIVLNDVNFIVDPVGYDEDIFTSHFRNNMFGGSFANENELNIFFARPFEDPARGIGRGGNFGLTTSSSSEDLLSSIVTGTFNSFLEGNLWTEGGFLAHEINHTLGLLHTWNTSQEELFEYECDVVNGFNNSSNHNMGYNGSLKYISPLQTGHIRRILTTSWREKLIANKPAKYHEFTLTEDFTIEENDIVELNKDLIIESGVTLTVKGGIKFWTESNIVVKPNAKLIVDGGVITSCNMWKGIEVYGGNSDFDVKFMNLAIIENTSNAAVSMFAPEPWPEIQNFGNGILNAENTTFNNVRRIAEFIAWSPSQNTSYINNCVQNGGKHSITNWNCMGIQVINNDFTNISHEAIVSSTGQYTISGNNIQSDVADVLLVNVTPGFGCDINENEFRGFNTGVRALGTALDEHLINDNQFFTGGFDIFIDGDNFYEIFNNDITSDFGITSINNGLFANDIYQNTFSGNLVGLLPSGTNSDYNFYENCFSTTITDVFIEGDIADFIAADVNSAANNCFTHQGEEASEINDMTGNPDPFKYVEPDDQEIDCLVAVKAHENIVKTQFGNSLNTCETSGSGNGTLPVKYTPCHPIKPTKNAKEIKDAIRKLETKIQQIKNNPYLSESLKKWYIKFYERCLKKVKRYYFEFLFERKNFEEVRSVLMREGTEDAQILIYSSYIYEGDNDSARNFLMSLSNPSEALSDFKTVQMMNLSRLSFGKFYEASSNQLSQLELLSAKNHPYAAYAKALYYEFTGDIITSEIPMEIKQSSPRKISPDKAIVYKVFPNPASDILNIDISNFETYDVTVFDLLGKQILVSKVEGRKQIKTELWENGVYFLTISKAENIVHQERIVVVK